MTDPLKQKFKHFTFKLYDKQQRHCKIYFDKQFQQFLDEPTITIIDWWYDYEGHTGVHVNGVFRSTNYKHISTKYAEKDTKIPDVYLKFNEIKDMHDYNGWIIYCIRRYDTNWKHYLPPQIQNEPKVDFVEQPPVIIF